MNGTVPPAEASARTAAAERVGISGCLALSQVSKFTLDDRRSKRAHDEQHAPGVTPRAEGVVRAALDRRPYSASTSFVYPSQWPEMATAKPFAAEPSTAEVPRPVRTTHAGMPMTPRGRWNYFTPSRADLTNNPAHDRHPGTIAGRGNARTDTASRAARRPPRDRAAGARGPGGRAAPHRGLPDRPHGAVVARGSRGPPRRRTGREGVAGVSDPGPAQGRAPGDRVRVQRRRLRPGEPQRLRRALRGGHPGARRDHAEGAEGAGASLHADGGLQAPNEPIRVPGTREGVPPVGLRPGGEVRHPRHRDGGHAREPRRRDRRGAREDRPADRRDGPDRHPEHPELRAAQVGGAPERVPDPPEAGLRDHAERVAERRRVPGERGELAGGLLPARDEDEHGGPAPELRRLLPRPRRQEAHPDAGLRRPFPL